MRPQELAQSIAAAIASQVGPLRTRVATLEQQLATVTTDLQEHPPLRAGGVWRPRTAFAAGEAVTYDGSLWICTTAHTAGDRFQHDHWRLAVKRGRDAKDAR